jgi:hypothetical protein
MKILIVYENIPESTDIYSVEVTTEEWEWMKLTHGYYVNFKMPDENEAACEKLSEFLRELEQAAGVAEGRDKIFSTEENETPKPINALGYDYIIHTGFGM